MKLKLEALDTQSPKDCTAFAEFVNRHYPSPFPVKADDARSGKYLFFWAVEPSTGARVGTTGLQPKTKFLAESVKSVIGPEHRGKGFGVALSEAIEAEAKRQGFRKLMTTIYVDNLPMIFIKLKQGFRFEGFHPDHEKPGLHEYSLGKVLE
jgi:RimJ/RimL family protein N-acetyltransferase